MREFSKIGQIWQSLVFLRFFQQHWSLNYA